MALSKAALLALRGLDAEKKKKLAADMDVHEKTVYRWLSSNDDNLTKAVAMKFIREETGLEDDQILESEPIGSQT